MKLRESKRSAANTFQLIGRGEKTQQIALRRASARMGFPTLFPGK